MQKKLEHQESFEPLSFWLKLNNTNKIKPNMVKIVHLGVTQVLCIVHWSVSCDFWSHVVSGIFW